MLFIEELETTLDEMLDWASQSEADCGLLRADDKNCSNDTLGEFKHFISDLRKR